MTNTKNKEYKDPTAGMSSAEISEYNEQARNELEKLEDLKKSRSRLWREKEELVDVLTERYRIFVRNLSYKYKLRDPIFDKGGLFEESGLYYPEIARLIGEINDKLEKMPKPDRE